MVLVGRPFHEVEATIEFAGAIVLGVGSDRANSCDIGRLQCSHDRVLEKARAKAFPLTTDGHAQPGKDHQRHRMPSKPLRETIRSVRIVDMADDERVKTDDLVAVERHICLGRATLLTLPGKARQKPIEFGAAAVKVIDSMVPPELLYSKPGRHDQDQSPSCSKRLGLVSNRARRGVSRGGASKAA